MTNPAVIHGLCAMTSALVTQARPPMINHLTSHYRFISKVHYRLPVSMNMAKNLKN